MRCKLALFAASGLTVVGLLPSPGVAQAPSYRSSFGGSAAYSRPYYLADWQNYPPGNYAPTTPSFAESSPRGGGDAAYVRIRVPQNARLWIQDQEVTQPGDERVVYSPSLAAGRDFVYTVTAVWRDENGREVHRSRQVHVQAGDVVRLDMRTAGSLRDVPATAGGTGQAATPGQPTGTAGGTGTGSGAPTGTGSGAPTGTGTGTQSSGQPLNTSGTPTTTAPNIGSTPNPASGRPTTAGTNQPGTAPFTGPQNPSGTAPAVGTGTSSTPGTGAVTDRPIGQAPGTSNVPGLSPTTRGTGQPIGSAATAPGSPNLPGASPTGPGSGTAAGTGTSTTGAGSGTTRGGSTPPAAPGAGPTGGSSGGSRGGSSR